MSLSSLLFDLFFFFFFFASAASSTVVDRLPEEELVSKGKDDIDDIDDFLRNKLENDRFRTGGGVGGVGGGGSAVCVDDGDAVDGNAAEDDATCPRFTLESGTMRIGQHPCLSNPMRSKD